MDNDKKNILVAGANGTTGRIIINILKNSKEYNPIAMVRKEEQKERFEKENVTTILADLEGNLTKAVTNVDKVIFAAGSGGKNVVGVDQDGAINLIDAAKQAGVNKFVMLSSMGSDNPSEGGDLKEYLEAKQLADKHLRACGMAYVIVRPGHLTNEEGKDKIELDFKLNKSGKISRADVANTLVEVLGDGVMQNQTFEILEGNIAIEKAVRSN